MIAYTHTRAILVSVLFVALAFAGFSNTASAAGDATLISYAVECAEESQLPNWGEWGLGGGDNRTIEPADIDAFVAASNGNCNYAAGWSFEWGMDYPYPEDSLIGPSGRGTVFGPTNAQGITETTIFVDTDEGRSTWFRAVAQEGYYGYNGKVEDNDVSSEFYCHTDLWHYDNNEVLTIVEDATYYCVLFTAELPGATPPSTPDAPTNPWSGFTRPSFPTWERPTFERPVFERPVYQPRTSPRFQPLPSFPSFGSRFSW